MHSYASLAGTIGVGVAPGLALLEDNAIFRMVAQASSADMDVAVGASAVELVGYTGAIVVLFD